MLGTRNKALERVLKLTGAEKWGQPEYMLCLAHWEASVQSDLGAGTTASSTYKSPEQGQQGSLVFLLYGASRAYNQEL